MEARLSVWHACWLATVLAFTVSVTAAVEFGFDPEVACGFMLEEGLRARGGYSAVGSGYECRSRPRNLMGGGPVNNTIRFGAGGDARQVTWLELELRVNARGAVQRTHAVLVEHADALFQRALGTALSDDIAAAILAGAAGHWSVNGRSISLDRAPPGAQRYGLRLRIE